MKAGHFHRFGIRDGLGEEALVPLAEDPGAHLRRERREGRRPHQVPAELRELDAQRGPVVLVTADGVADDHRDPLGVDAPVRPSGVEQGRPCARDRPLLAEVELLTIRIRLLVCSLDKAQEIGLPWTLCANPAKRAGP